MAHYALLDSNNIVTQVITGKDPEPGADWEQEYSNIFNQKCKRTSYNTIAGKHTRGETPFRKNYAGIGYSYDAQRDAFIPPQPYPSWSLNEDSCTWNPPIPMPTDGRTYNWNEDLKTWIYSPVPGFDPLTYQL